MPEAMGVANGGFEFGSDFANCGWAAWSRTDAGKAELVSPGRVGQRCLKFTHTGDRSSSSG